MLSVIRIERSDWDRVYSKNAHEAVFEHPYDPETSRADFALLVIHQQKDEPVIYVTVSEANSKGATIEFGGSFPPYRGSFLTYKAYETVLDYLSQKYKQAYMMVRNDNKAMLKFALKSDFLITGFSLGPDNSLLLEHTLDFTKTKEK